MRARDGVDLSTSTTLRLGGPAARVVEVETVDELCEVVRELDDEGSPVLVLGGGSNVVIADAGFPGTVVEVRLPGVVVESVDDCSGVTVRVRAGENWDEFVTAAITQGWVGVEALSGIPGLVGAAPMQNIGAYGQEVADAIAQVRVWDRPARAIRTFAASECGFGYRTSRFKQELGRYVVLEVIFQLRPGDLGAPIRYAELARTLGVEQGARVPMSTVRDAVLDLRGRKGMVLDPSDHDTWSAGSFFTNPILDEEAAAELPQDAPRWPQPGGGVKTSAAWLIEHAGFTKGYGPSGGHVRLSTKHTLALTNRGGATTDELLDLAREVRDGVTKAFGIVLEPEPVLVGCSL
ncbi:MAG TPA: UDP-N-acetylmuramate dehydrogenase [Actinopolymorphaceae bacterium]